MRGEFNSRCFDALLQRIGEAGVSTEKIDDLADLRLQTAKRIVHALAHLQQIGGD